MITHTVRLRAKLLLDPAKRPANSRARLRAVRRDMDGIIDAIQSAEIQTKTRQDANWIVIPIQVNGVARDEASLSLETTFQCRDSNPVDVHRMIEHRLKPRLAARFNALLRAVQALPNADRWIVGNGYAWDDECSFNGQPTTLHQMKALRGQFHIES